MSFIYESFTRDPVMYLKIGVVKSLDNSKDNKRKDRVLVFFPDEGSECFASVMYNYAGKDYGNFWYPDPDTIVVVAFIENCLDGAIIIGCLNKYENNLHPINKENNKDFFKHKNGTTVEFFNKDKESKISIKTKEEKETIDIDFEKEILDIKSKNNDTEFKFDFKNSKISIKCKEMDLEIAEKLNIKGKSVNVDLNDKCNIKAAGINFESKGDLSIKSSGGAAKMQSATGITIKSNGMVNIN